MHVVRARFVRVSSAPNYDGFAYLEWRWTEQLCAFVPANRTSGCIRSGCCPRKPWLTAPVPITSGPPPPPPPPLRFEFSTPSSFRRRNKKKGGKQDWRGKERRKSVPRNRMSHSVHRRTMEGREEAKKRGHAALRDENKWITKKENGGWFVLCALVERNEHGGSLA